MKRRHKPSSPLIRQWLETIQPKVCFLCGGKGDWRGLQVHHVERKSQVHNEREDWPENLFLCCAPCHEGPLATMSHPEQLSYKWRHDHCGHASLGSFVARWRLVKYGDDRAPNRVTVAEVESFLRRAA